MSAWCYPTAFTGKVCPVSVSFSSTVFHILIFDATGHVQAESNAGSTVVAATTVAAASTNAWCHAAATFASATSRAAFLNGGSKATNATSRAPSGINRCQIGILSNTFNTFTGNVGEVAIWSAVLSDGEIATLATGVPAWQVRSASLWGYWLVGLASPEPDYSGAGRAMTLVGTPTLADGPPVGLWMPPVRGPVNVVAAAVGRAPTRRSFQHMLVR
jgi:hypothetical protein